MSKSFSTLPARTGTGGVRPSLLWTLAAVGAASAASVWWPDPPATVTAVSAAAERQAPSNQHQDGARGEPPSRHEPAETADADPAHILPSKRDPFVAPAPPSAPTVHAPRPVQSVQPDPAPVALLPMPYRFWGRMTGPDAKTQTYLARGDEALVVNTGDRLPEGWLVEHIKEDAVQLHYPPSGQRAVIAITHTAEEARLR